MLKYLRIAVTVLSLAASVLLVALWVRTYPDRPGKGYLPAPANVCCRSTGGIVIVLKLPKSDYQPDSKFLETYAHESGKHVDLAPTPTWSGFHFHGRSMSFWYIQAPLWFPIALSAALSAVPWIHRRPRFSVRTLLIATTLVAVELGIIVATT